MTPAPNPWERVVAATDGHNLESVEVRLTEGGPWVYTQCSCYPASETFTEAWMFTDHIRRLAFAAAPVTDAGLREVQRYSLELDEAGQAYMELDPGGRWVLFKEVSASRQAEKETA